VVVTSGIRRTLLSGLTTLLLLFPLLNQAAVLPEDRADALYHRYEGGGVVIDGPSILVRKSFKDTVSVSANYYVDNVSSASIDVVTTASAYTEKRTEGSIGVDYLRDKTTLSMNYTNSTENDYNASTASFNFSQDFFGDLTTISAGYSQGWDVVTKRGDASFSKQAKRRQYRMGLSQIITKNSLIGMTWETITDAGFLNNPYRSVRYLDPTSSLGYAYQSELYPATRTSDAFAIRGMYYLSYRAAIKAEARIFVDTWGVEAKNLELTYTHPLQKSWVFDIKLRHYQQTKADFYNDLFSRIDAQNFLARDKELSTYSDDSISFGVSYDKEVEWGPVDRFSLNFAIDYIKFDYKDFRDLRVQTTPGQEPLYNFDAIVTRMFFSVWY